MTYRFGENLLRNMTVAGSGLSLTPFRGGLYDVSVQPHHLYGDKAVRQSGCNPSEEGSEDGQTAGSTGLARAYRGLEAKRADAVGVLRSAWAARLHLSALAPTAGRLLFIGSFAVSVVNGVRYKIVPQLASFHQKGQLQACAGSITTMREMNAERWIHWHFLRRRSGSTCCLPRAGLVAVVGVSLDSPAPLRRQSALGST
jgi:hypothetical protein